MEAVCFEVFERTSSSYATACDLQTCTFYLGVQEARFTDTMVSHSCFYVALGVAYIHAAVFNHRSFFLQ